MYQFKVMYKIQDDGSYLASVPSLPGCIASGESFDEAQIMIQDAMQGCIAVYEEEGIEIRDDQTSIETYVSIPSFQKVFTSSKVLA